MLRRRKAVSERNPSETPWRTFGIIGAGRAVGTTHLTVWTANWLASVLREPVAVLEWNDHGDFERMRHFCRGEERSGGFWRLLDVDYFSAAGSAQLAACMNGSYRRILIDYGAWSEEGRLEWIRCDRKAMVGSLSEWQAGVFLDRLREKPNGQEQAGSAGWSREPEFFAAFGSEEARTSVEKELKATVRRIPFSTDAFAVTGADLQFFQKWNTLA